MRHWIKGKGCRSSRQGWDLRALMFSLENKDYLNNQYSNREIASSTYSYHSTVALIYSHTSSHLPCTLCGHLTKHSLWFLNSCVKCESPMALGCITGSKTIQDCRRQRMNIDHWVPTWMTAAWWSCWTPSDCMSKDHTAIESLQHMGYYNSIYYPSKSWCIL